jgi:hypothetical protein
MLHGSARRVGDPRGTAQMVGVVPVAVGLHLFDILPFVKRLEHILRRVEIRIKAGCQIIEKFYKPLLMADNEFGLPFLYHVYLLQPAAGSEIRVSS